jgi:hypothetical protein
LNEGTIADDVVHYFVVVAANFAAGLIQYVLSYQRRPALDPSLHQKLAKKLDPWRCKVLPDKLERRALVLAARRRPVYEAKHEAAVVIFKEACALCLGCHRG